MTSATDAPPASTLEHEVYLALQRFALRLHDEAEEVFKAQGLSSTQFNVLRILRGAGAQGLTCGEIAARLLNRDPDVTRLLDRMEKQGLVVRARSEQDRRVVLTRLSSRGSELVGHFDEPLAGLHQRQFAHLQPGQLLALLDLLQAPAP